MPNTSCQRYRAGVAAFLLIAGPWWAFGQTTVVEDFEGFNVTATILDPTTVGGSGWTRDGVGVSDWDVLENVPPINTVDLAFDGTPQYLVQRRSTSVTPKFSDENTDFAIPTIVEGSVSLEMNPAFVAGDAGDSFRMSLHDSGSGSNAMTIVFTQLDWPVGSSGDFRVLDQTNAVLAEGIIPNDPDTDNPTARDRWFRILVTLHGNGTYDVNVFDIGPVKDSAGVPRPYHDPARGEVLTLTGASLPVASVDTFRLTPGSTNGFGLQPTLIDNIIARDYFEFIEIDRIKPGAQISFPTQAGKIYQPQFSDDGSTWSNVGGLVPGDGTTQSVVASTTGAPEGREYRVLEF